MIFLSTRKLVADLTEDKVNDKEALKYFIGSTVLMIFTLYYSILMGGYLNALYIIEFIAVALISVRGLLEAYEANGGDNGKRFIIKTVCILFPVSIKVSALSIAVGWAIYLGYPFIFGYDGEVFKDPAKAYQFYIMLHSALFTYLLYWRIKVNIKLTVFEKSS